MILSSKPEKWVVPGSGRAPSQRSPVPTLIVGAALFSFVSIGTSSIAHAQAGPYVERTLSSGGYTTTQVNGISLSGSTIIGTGTTGSSTAGLEWSSSSTTPTNLNESGITNTQADATDGTNIDGLGTSGGNPTVVVWNGTNFGSFTTITPPFPTYSNLSVVGINGSLIAGSAVVSGTETAYAYNYSTQAADALNPTGSTGAETYGLSGTTIVGDATISSVQRAGVWTGLTSASFVNLGSLLNATTYGASVADAIYAGSSSSLIVGNAVENGSTNHVAVAWSGSGSSYTTTVLNSGTYTSTYALATNGTSIVGYGVDGSGVDHALLWTADNSSVSPINLGLDGLPSSGANSMATGIDSRGDIVGSSSGQGFELYSAPEPGSLALVLPGLVGAGVTARRLRRKSALIFLTPLPPSL